MLLVTTKLEELGYPYQIWNQRRVENCQLDYAIEGGTVVGAMTIDGIQTNLEDITGVYVRMIDDDQLPEIKNLPPTAPERKHSRAMHEALLLWLDVTSARVANRPAANASNGSKPWQTRLIEKAGVKTPATLVTNHPASVRSFHDRYKSIIYKSASGFRSIVRPLERPDDLRLADIRWCPVQFQHRIPGRDVRVHVVGDEVFATLIVSEATDYRYAAREGLEADITTFDLSPDLRESCCKLSRELDLPFAGIDLRISDDGSAWCFEVNPCPGFSYYESHTGQPIAEALCRYLRG